MRAGGFPDRAAQGLSLLLYSPGSHGGHIKWPPARAELASGQRSLPNRDRFILVGFIWGNVALQRLSALTYYL